MKYLATIRVTFDAEDEIEAQLVAHDLVETTQGFLEEDDTIDVTQVVPFGRIAIVEPAELVTALRRACDMLITTRITQCFELAKDIHRTAWILEHRGEETFDLSGYDYGAIFTRAKELLDADG